MRTSEGNSRFTSEIDVLAPTAWLGCTATSSVPPIRKGCAGIWSRHERLQMHQNWRGPPRKKARRLQKSWSFYACEAGVVRRGRTGMTGVTGVTLWDGFSGALRDLAMLCDGKVIRSITELRKGIRCPSAIVAATATFRATGYREAKADYLAHWGHGPSGLVRRYRPLPCRSTANSNGCWTSCLTRRPSLIAGM